MARKTIFGKCHLCLEEKDLNFEHVPPKCAFNKETKYKITPFLDLMQTQDPFNLKVKGRLEQGGIGVNAFCTNCNNFLGRKYVNAYLSWVKIAATAIGQGNYIGHDYSAFNQYPNKLLKQVISMFLAINTPEFSETNYDLSRFVLDPDTTELKEKYQIYTYLNTKGKTRYIPMTMVGNLKEGSSSFCTEITFPPCGFVLCLNPTTKSNELLRNITHFKSTEPNKKYNVDIKINKLETHLPFPLDYRTKEEIKAAINKGNE